MKLQVSEKLISFTVCVSFFVGNNWALTREHLSSGFANNTGTDQPAHPRSLISAFVIHYLESSICKLVTCEISIL